MVINLFFKIIITIIVVNYIRYNKSFLCNKPKPFEVGTYYKNINIKRLKILKYEAIRR